VAAGVCMALIAEGGVLAIGLPGVDPYFATVAPANALGDRGDHRAVRPGTCATAGPDGVFGRTDPKLITLDNPLGMDAADPRGQG